MQLVVCTSIFPNPEAPNRGIYVFRKLSALNLLGGVRAVVPIPYFPRGVPSKRYATWARVPGKAQMGSISTWYPRVLVTPGIGRPLYGLSYAAGMYGTVRRLIAERRPAALLGVWAYPDGFATVLLARRFRLPVVVWALGCDVNNLAEFPAKARLVRWTLRNSTGVIAMSAAMQRHIVGLGVLQAKTVAISNGVDSSFLADETAGDSNIDRSTAASRPVVLFCGRLSPEKGILTLVAAAQLLLRRRPDVQFRILGSGPQRQQAEDAVNAAGIAANVTFAGETHHTLIPGEMRAATVLCLPSLREGCPNVILEALASGTPVVGTKVGGIPEIVTNESLGLLVPSEDPAELARALERALATAWDRTVLRAAGRRRSWNDVARDAADFIGRVIS
jgi:teichuronic acid biosynthesis glycosyltransferase TuaC